MYIRGEMGRTEGVGHEPGLPPALPRSHQEIAGGRPEGAATALGPRGSNGDHVQSPAPWGMGWPGGFPVPANPLRAKEAGGGF